MGTHQIQPGFHLNYLEINPAGGPTVVLLHGLGATGDSWQLQFPALEAGGYRVLAPDMRGFGHSGYPGKMSVAAMAADVASLLEAQTHAPVHMVGISMGGTVAQQLALDAPQRIERLVLVNTFAKLRPNKPGAWLYFAWRMILVHGLGLEVQAKAVSKRLFPHPHQAGLRTQLQQQIQLANPRAYRATMRALALFNIANRLDEIHHPTLIITGEEDTTVLPPNQQLLVDSIPNARQIVIHDGGHGVSVDSATAFNTALLGFLTE